MDSPMSSAISISSVPSVTSDINHSHILGENENTIDQSSHLDSQEEPNASQGRTIVPEYQGKPLFEPGDGDYMFWVNDTCFEAHKYLLKRFSVLKSLFHDQSAIKLQRDEGGVEDFRNTLAVLYATILEGPFDFEKSTLVSALRISTAYDYPALSLYAIDRLEKARLTAIERIKIVREFGLESWEEPAYLELCERDEPITMEEASVLGMDMFVRVAGIREREQRRRGKKVDARKQGQEAKPNVSEENGDKPDGDHEAAKGNKSDKAEPDSSSQKDGTEMKPSFHDVQISDDYARDKLVTGMIDCHLAVPGCSCRFPHRPTITFTSHGTRTRSCTLPPCAVAAFKNLQVQQITHANSIANLQSSMNKLDASVIQPAPTPAPKPSPTCSKRSHSLIHEEVRLMLSVTRESLHED